MIENPASVNGIIGILSRFSESEVLTLCGTVTQGLLKNKIRNREEAIGGILKHSANETSLLKRKIITRQHLFEYLHDLGVAVTLPTTKDELIEKITKLWYNNPPPYCPHSSVQLPIAQALQNEQESEISASTSSCDMIGTQNSDINCSSLNGNFTDHMLSTMATEFSEWFYGLMNKSERIGIEHFYPDASLHIQFINNDIRIKKQALNNANEVSQLLFDTRQEHNLFFHPNLLPDGTNAKMNKHGLVLVLSCGTLHISQLIAGVFEQIFALARDPFSENNWKIKYSTLILRNKPNCNSIPCLQDSELLQIQNS